MVVVSLPGTDETNVSYIFSQFDFKIQINSSFVTEGVWINKSFQIDTKMRENK